MDSTRGSGRLVAWCALLLGGCMSIAANALHVVQVIGPSMGGASVPQIVGAAFWPVALILAVEVIARVSWPAGLGYRVIRWGGVGAVAVVAAIVSYRHMHGLLLHWGEDPVTALLGPIGVDGLVSIGAVALMACSNTEVHETASQNKPENEVNDRPVVHKETAPAEPVPAPVEPEPEPVFESEPVPVSGPVVDEAAIAKVGLPPALQSKVVDRLSQIVSDGGRPEPDDLADVGLPSSFARRVITAGINGSMS